jgi:hypothetical protein
VPENKEASICVRRKQEKIAFCHECGHKCSPPRNIKNSSLALDRVAIVALAHKLQFNFCLPDKLNSQVAVTSSSPTAWGSVSRFDTGERDRQASWRAMLITGSFAVSIKMLIQHGFGLHCLRFRQRFQTNVGHCHHICHTPPPPSKPPNDRHGYTALIRVSLPQSASRNNCFKNLRRNLF